MTDDAFQRALQAAYQALGGAADRFPPPRPWEPLAGDLGTEEGHQNQEVAAAVPTVPRVPTEKQDRDARTLTDEPLTRPVSWSAWQERAAIREFEAGLDRAMAEVLTAIELGPCPPQMLADMEADGGAAADPEGIASIDTPSPAHQRRGLA